MGDTTASTGGAESRSGRPAIAIAVVLAVAAAGLTAGPVGGAIGADATDHGDAESVQVTDECEDGAGLLTVENPTDEPVAVTVDWTVEQPSMALQVESGDGTQTVQVSQAGGAGTVETTQTIATATGQQELAIEMEPGTMTVTMPAAQELTIAGLADDTYEFAATIDDRPVDVEPDAVTIECDGE